MSKAPTTRRILKEFENFKKDKIVGCDMKQVNEDDIYKYHILFSCPDGSDYESCNYLLSLIYPFEYPFSPPIIRFLSPILHPNVSESGEICLNILKKDDGWSPALSVSKVILSLQNLMMEPNPDSALNIDAVLEKRKNPESFKLKVKTMSDENQPNF